MSDEMLLNKNNELNIALAAAWIVAAIVAASFLIYFIHSANAYAIIISAGGKPHLSGLMLGINPTDPAYNQTLTVGVVWQNGYGPFNVRLYYGTSQSCANDTTPAYPVANVITDNEYTVMSTLPPYNAPAYYYYCAKVTDMGYFNANYTTNTSVQVRVRAKIIIT